MLKTQELTPFTKTLSLLYIDSDEQTKGMMVTELSKIFSHVDDALDSVNGINYARINRYDLIVADMKSTAMSGVKLVENLKNINPAQHILVTAENVSKEELIALINIGIDGIVLKPIKMQEFFSLLNKSIQMLFEVKEAEKNKQVKDDLLYERKRLGRLMQSQKDLEVKLENYKKMLHTLKFTDTLTGVASKNALQTSLKDDIQSIIYLNIDNFNFFNDIYGMGHGNIILKETAKRIEKFLPNNAELFHITADEFVVLLHSPSNDQEFLLAKQLQAVFKELPITFEHYSHILTFSIGVVRGKGKALFVRSKSASQEARFYGGDKIVYYNSKSEYMQKLKEKLYWIQQVTIGLEKDTFLLHYQPIVNTKSNRIIYFEVLCRLQADTNKLVDAEKFIDVAGETGVITQITKIVIDKAFKYFAHNQYKFSINISKQDIHERYLVQLLRYKCETYSIAPSRVLLEIVENLGRCDAHVMTQEIEALKKAGFAISINNVNDSIYNRMLEFKADFLKIDGQLFKNIDTDDRSRLILKNLISFSKEAGIRVVAEHIDSKEIQAIASRLGVEYSQGYLFGKPQDKVIL